MLAVVPFVEVEKFVASDGDSNDRFGLPGVDISNDGSVFVVGDYFDNIGNNEKQGSAYVYEWNGSQYDETKLTASDGAANDNFGHVAISGDAQTIVVGAGSAAAAYVFRSNSEGYAEVAKLTASDASDRFYGWSVDVSSDGQTIAVGSRHNGDAGAAYIYRWVDGKYFESKLTPHDGGSRDMFGSSVALSPDGSTLVVGSFDNDQQGIDAGAAYVYRRDNNEYVFDQKLVASDGTDEDIFGLVVDVSVDGGTIVVGSDANAAYLYLRNDDGSYGETILTASDDTEGELFGRPVSVSDDGTTVVTGNVRGSTESAAYVFEATSIGFRETKIVSNDPNGSTVDAFGWAAVSGNGKKMVIANWYDNDIGDSTGSVALYGRLTTSPPIDTFIDSATDGFGGEIVDQGETFSDAMTFQFRSDDPTNAFECNINESGYFPCDASTTFALSGGKLVNGVNHLLVRALDAEGEPDSSPAEFTWTVRTLVEAIQNLQQVVDDLEIEGGDRRDRDSKRSSMLRHLQDAIERLPDGYAQASIAHLNVFIRIVDNLRGQPNGRKPTITDAQADMMVEAANQIIVGISSAQPAPESGPPPKDSPAPETAPPPKDDGPNPPTGPPKNDRPNPNAGPRRR